MNENTNQQTAKSAWRIAFRLLAPLFILLIGAAGFLPTSDHASRPSVPVASDTNSGKKFPAAPAFKLKDLSGKEVQLSDFKGKVVILNFWATWCGPCRFETPALVEFRHSYQPRGVEIVGISLDDDGPGVVSKFVQQYKVPYPVVMSDQSTIEAYGPIEAVPTTFIIDKEGRVRNRYVGLLPFNQFKKEVDSLL